MGVAQKADVIVIGAGMAGASVAAELAAATSGRQRIILLERESQPGYHTTGRSAALYTQAYGPPLIRALSRASHSFFLGQAAGEPPQGLLHDRGALFVARSDQVDALAHLQEELGAAVIPKSAAQAREMVPILRPGYAASALLDRTAADIDVHALHQYYLKRFRAEGGVVQTDAGVNAIARADDNWEVETPAGRFQAATLVNAAGAWADQIAEMAGLAPLELRPLRRTALLVAPPPGAIIEGWPMLVDAEEKFYMKPDAGKLLMSPADETLSPPCDAQPEELDVAICVDRIETACDIQVRRIEHKWAGLRSFLPDGNPAAGFAPEAPGFFWLAGQGGYGIQSAPALARAAAALVLQTPLPEDLVAEGVSAAALSPARFGQAL